VSRQPRVEVQVAAKTDLGRTRDHNEDTFLVADLTRGTAEVRVNGGVSVGPRGILFMVADGMGGAAAGEVASAMAADIVLKHILATWTPSDSLSGDEFIARLREAVEDANARIHEYAKEHPDVRGMGTTATVVGIFGARLHLAQVGDSRAYLIRRGETVQLTKDQSLMQRLIDAGELTEEQAAQSERRNIILQALGPDARIRVDLTYQDVSRGDTLVICSDGLSGQVKREEIGRAVAEAADVVAVCDTLIALANERGGPDNITTVVARFEGDGLPEPATAEDPGYHSYPLPEEITGESVVVEAAPPAEPPPVEVDPDPEPPEQPAMRNGSPVVMASIGIAVLLLLLATFLLLAT